MQVQPRMDVFDPLDELVRKHQRRLQGELTAALPEEFLQTAP